MREIVLIYLLLLSPSAYAVSDLTTTLGLSQQGSSLSSQVNSTSDETTRFFQRLDLNLDPITSSQDLKLLNQMSFQLGLESAQPDYSKTLIRQASGNEVPLSQLTDVKMEFSGNVGANYFFNDSSIGLNFASTLSQSPYARQSVGFQYQQSFHEKTTIASLSGSLSSQKQPESYYLNIDFQTKQRPGVVHSNALSASVQQVLTERWNAKAIVSTSQRIEERPRNISLELKQKYALFEEFFVGLDVFHLNEIENEALKNDRGFFTLWSGTLSAIFQPTYALELLVSYSLAVEEEFDPRRTLLTTQGSDQYDLSAKYQFSFGTAFTKISHLVSASNFKQTNFQGGLIWKL